MNDLPNATPNPYDSGQAARPDTAGRAKRPIGTLILAAIFLLSGLWVGGQRCYQLISVFSSGDNVVIHPSFYVAMTRDIVTSATALLGAIGLLLGQTFGWWLSLMHAYWRLSIQGLLPLLGAMAAQSSPDASSQSNPISAALIASFIFLLNVLYLQKKAVLFYFGANVRRAIVNAVLLVSCLGIAFGLDVWWAVTQR